MSRNPFAYKVDADKALATAQKEVATLTDPLMIAVIDTATKEEFDFNGAWEWLARNPQWCEGQCDAIASAIKDRNECNGLGWEFGRLDQDHPEITAIKERVYWALARRTHDCRKRELRNARAMLRKWSKRVE